MAVVFLAFGYVAWEQRDRLIQRNQADLRSNAFFLADHAARLFEIADLTLKQGSALIDDANGYRGPPTRRLWEQLRAIQEALPYIDDIRLSDATGRLRLISEVFPTPDADIATRDAFKAQVGADSGLFVGQPVLRGEGSEPTFMVSRRLQGPDGSFQGVVAVTVPLSYFDLYWQRLQLPKGGRVTLLRADTKIVAQWPAPTDGISFVPIHKETFDQTLAQNPQQGSYSYVMRGERRVSAFHQVGDLPLYILVSMPADAYWGVWVKQARLYGAFALVALVSFLALAVLARQHFREQAANAALLTKQVMMRTSELRKETAALEVLNRTGTALAGELEVDRIVQGVVDAGVDLTGAQVGAFFYNGGEDPDAAELHGYRLFASTGVTHNAFASFPAVRHTALFEPTFDQGEIVRSDDITRDPRYGQNEPFNGIPSGHPGIRSYMAVPVISRTGANHGALLFGHERRGVFTERVERLMQGLAAQAAIALDNGHLYQAAQHEIAERAQVQSQQALLIRELHHRVKNTLATVQAVVGATARSATNIDDFYQAFVGRIISLANTHSLLTEAVWQTASLRDILDKELSPYHDGNEGRIVLEGPPVELPSEAAVPIGMAIHELTTNAAKYGALSVDAATVTVQWALESCAEGLRLKLTWLERGGPAVTLPKKQGFGSRLLHRVLATQLNAKVEISYDQQGLRASIEVVLKEVEFLQPVS
ncbi:HWE histidine kinase domain-containing protein [Microvirga terricola]|uniref:histidine kinase n=1 Tax=Microvirga terricola TaxID=2719797 RepID=A0ABX0VDS6_9HYPH|nr:HWE histidine kinase domain-containing protein [Microvirga terricola]NIX77984.1 GAF domain-containing protein [Microvirga terricola]